MAYSVLVGLVTAWRLADWPTRRSPLSVNATMLGVVRAPSLFSMTRTSLPSMTATQEFVVPRSMPMTLLIHMLLCSGCRRPEAPRASPRSKSVTVDVLRHRLPGKCGLRVIWAVRLGGDAGL